MEGVPVVPVQALTAVFYVKSAWPAHGSNDGVAGCVVVEASP